MASRSRLAIELVRDRTLRAPSIAAKAALARGFWGIRASKFLMLGMHDQPISRWQDSMDFTVGLDPVLRMVNWQGDGRRLNADKLLTAERLADAGIPFAPLVACVGRDKAVHSHGGRFAQWSTLDEIARALPSCPDRLFVKPADGAHGHHVFAPERRDGGWDVGGDRMSDEQLARRLVEKAPPAGLLLQDRVRSHAGLTAIGGDLGLGTVRINTALMPDGVEIVFAFAKILRSRNLVDNFSGGRSGNLVARVDPVSGKLVQVYGRRPEQRFLMETITEHPVTGTVLPGFQLPLWDQAVAMTKRVAEAFPESPLIGSDVAITDDGPLIIETNANWDSNPAEIALGGGLRPVLEDLIPRLALDGATKRRAIEHLRVSPRESPGLTLQRLGQGG